MFHNPHVKLWVVYFTGWTQRPLYRQHDVNNKSRRYCECFERLSIVRFCWEAVYADLLLIVRFSRSHLTVISLSYPQVDQELVRSTHLTCLHPFLIKWLSQVQYHFVELSRVLSLSKLWHQLPFARCLCSYMMEKMPSHWNSTKWCMEKIDGSWLSEQGFWVPA